MNKQILLVFGVLWTILVLIGYWGFHPYYSVALGDLPNFRLFITLVVLCGGAWWAYRTNKFVLKGWMIYGFVLLLQSVAFLVYSSGADVFKDSPAVHLPYYLGYNLLLHGSILYLALVQLATGELILKLIPLELQARHRPVVSVALGLSLNGFILILLAMGGWLFTWLLWILSLIPLVFTYRIIWKYVKEFVISPVQTRYPGWSAAAFLMMVIAMAINHTNAIKPFPTGFDAAALYMNSSHLIAGYQSMIQGGQAMAWPLLTSMGELMFSSVSVSLMISHMAMLLVLWALYRLGRLFLAPEFALLAVVTLYLNPAFSFHAAFDAKVDLGFLFIILTILLMLLDRDAFDAKPAHEEVQSEDGSMKAEWMTWGLAGWLSGYAFSIKYTASLLIIGLIVLLFRKFLGWKGAAGVLMVSLGLLFQVGIDQFGFMELGDTPPFVFALVSYGIGLVLLGWGSLGHFNTVLPVAKRLIWLLIPASVAFAPWAVKNGLEHDTFSLGHLLEGKSQHPVLVNHADEAILASHVSRHKQFILNFFQRLGISMNSQQQDVANQLMSSVLTETADPDTWSNEYQQARQLIIDNALYPEQKELVSRQIEEYSGTISNAGQNERQILERIQVNLERRGVLLDDAQRSRILAMISETRFMDSSDEVRRQNMAEFKKKVFEQVLTPEQNTKMNALQTGDLEFTLDQQVVQSMFFGGSKREEIKRYIGYEEGAPLYLSLPYDMTMNTNVPFSRYLDISFLFLLILPFFFFGKTGWTNGLIAAGVLLFWLISVRSLYTPGMISGQESLVDFVKLQMGRPTGILGSILGPVFLGIQVLLVDLSRLVEPLYQGLAQLPFIWTYVGLLGMAAIGLFLSHDKLSRLPGPLNHLFLIALTFGGLWFLVGNAIIWYGFPFFAIGFLLLAWLVQHAPSWAPDLPGKWVKNWWISAYAISLTLCLSLFFVSAVQDQQRAQMIFQTPFLKYASTPIDADVCMQMFRPYMSEAINKMNEDMDAKIYRIGTHLNYYIKENDRRVLEDNQLELYKDVSSRMQDKEDFIRLLVENGFRYVLYNINIASTDRTPEQSLARKGDEILRVLTNSRLANPIFTDNFIEDPAIPRTKVGDQYWNGKPGIGEKVTVPGTFLLFELVKS